MSAKADELDLDVDLVITLRKPIEGPAGMITEIIIAEPTADQMMQWDKLAGIEADIAAVSVVAGIPKVVAGKLPAREFQRAVRRIAAFLD